MDALGYGASENPYRSCTMDDLADAALEVASSLLLLADEENESSSPCQFVTIGTLLGCFLCISLASRYPEQCQSLHLGQSLQLSTQNQE